MTNIFSKNFGLLVEELYSGVDELEHIDTVDEDNYLRLKGTELRHTMFKMVRSTVCHQIALHVKYLHNTRTGTIYPERTSSRSTPTGTLSRKRRPPKLLLNAQFWKTGR